MTTGSATGCIPDACATSACDGVDWSMGAGVASGFYVHVDAWGTGERGVADAHQSLLEDASTSSRYRALCVGPPTGTPRPLNLRPDSSAVVIGDEPFGVGDALPGTSGVGVAWDDAVVGCLLRRAPSAQGVGPRGCVRVKLFAVSLLDDVCEFVGQESTLVIGLSGAVPGGGLDHGG